MVVRFVTISSFIYFVIIGATYRGILLPETRLASLLILSVLLAGWAILRWHSRAHWHRTPLDSVLPLWGLAFLLSTLFNLDASRRILLALWYMGLYIGAWYIIHDAVANGWLKLQTLVTAILVSGLIVVVLGYLELQQVVLPSGLSLFSYRPRSIIGNPNTLAAFLMILILAVMSQISSTRLRVARLGLVIYLLAAGFLFFLTFSRGAWLGLGGAIIMGAILQSWLSPAFLRSQWQQQSNGRRKLIISIALAVAVIGGLLALRLGQTLIGSGRTDNGRLELCQTALSMFGDNPLVGKGLFTFSRNLGQYTSLPPESPFAHAHSLPLNLAGELGLVGLIAFGYSLYLLIRWLKRDSIRQSQYGLLGSVAIVGLGLGHIFDMPTITPVIALTSLVVLILITEPQHAPIITFRYNILAHNLGIGGLVLTLLIVGFWDASIYSRYLNILWPGVYGEQYTATANALQTVTDADPTLPIYPAQQAFLWGVAAADGDLTALQPAIDAYERVIQMEPYYAPYYANLAALYWDAGQTDQGLTMMEQAAALANDSWAIQFNLGMFAEALGNEDQALAAYQQALRAEPDADLHPDWAASPLRATLQSPLENHSTQAQIILLMEAGRVDEALTLWESTFDERSTNYFILRSLLALAQNQPDEALAWTERARQTSADPLWVALNEVYIARYKGDVAAADRTLAALREQITSTNHPLETDYQTGSDIAFYHYFRQTTPRQFLPQVFYPQHSLLLLHLLSESATP